MLLLRRACGRLAYGRCGGASAGGVPAAAAAAAARGVRHLAQPHTALGSPAASACRRASAAAGKGFGSTTSGSGSSKGGSSGSSSATPRGGASSGSSVGTAAAAAEPAAPPVGGDMYQQPPLYDEVFAYRDFDAEAAFVRAAYARHCPGAPLATVLELGCGPARHSTLLASSGARAFALDASPAMLEYARSLADAAGADVTFIQGDMADFDVPAVAGQLDAAICLLGTFSHMLSNDAAASAFRCVARHLRPGGLLLLELAHPGDLFDGSLVIGDEGGEMWEVDSASAGGKLLVEWGAEGDDFDPATQVLRRTVTVTRLEGGQPGARLHESRVLQRSFTLQELDLLGRLAGLKLAGTYGDLSLSVGLGHEDAYRLVACFVKEG